MIGKPFLIFPGQGAQYPGMALDLLEQERSGKRIKDLFLLASKIYGEDMASVLAGCDPQALKRTDISQPAITLANLAAAAYLERKFLEKGIAPAGCAGFSLGEYAALAIAGVITEEDCFSLVTQRGKIMQAAAEKIAAGGDAPGMAAVTGLAPQKVESLLNGWKADNPALTDIFAANINSPGQIVIAGTAKALSQVEGLFTAAGAKRYLRLNVAGPFHSPLMAEAAQKFQPVLEKITFNDPKIPFYSNVSGKRVLSGEEAKKLALDHITSPVRWIDEEKSIETAGGFNCLLEAGPGKVLQGLWKDFGSSAPCYAAGTAEDINKLFADNEDGNDVGK